MKFLFVVALIALAIQLAVAQSGSATTTTEAATTTTTTTAATDTATTTTTAASVPSATTKKPKKRCWRGNNWCNTRQQVKCKNPKRCVKTIVVVRRYRG